MYTVNKIELYPKLKKYTFCKIILYILVQFSLLHNSDPVSIGLWYKSRPVIIASQ